MDIQTSKICDTWTKSLINSDSVKAIGYEPGCKRLALNLSVYGSDQEEFLCPLANISDCPDQLSGWRKLTRYRHIIMSIIGLYNNVELSKTCDSCLQI